MELQKKIFFYYTILDSACISGNIDIVKYIISLNKIDITDTNIYNIDFIHNDISLIIIFIQFIINICNKISKLIKYL